MHAEIGTVKEPDLRVQIVEQRAAFDQSPVPLENLYRITRCFKSKIVDARSALKTVTLDYDFRVKISQICSDVDGLRGDIDK
jgi:magnesium chelatase subunit I